jgi:hypothetical protein
LGDARQPRVDDREGTPRSPPLEEGTSCETETQGRETRQAGRPPRGRRGHRKEGPLTRASQLVLGAVCLGAAVAVVGLERPWSPARTSSPPPGALLPPSRSDVAPGRKLPDLEPPDPAGNAPAFTTIPAVCAAAPQGSACESDALDMLDTARVATGLARYALPPGFVSLAPTVQVFILANLDRTAYGLQPVAGLSPALDAIAAKGVATDSDPNPPANLNLSYASNAASGGIPNVLYTYYIWMYDDGYGSPNADCSAPKSAGCWGHRRDIFALPSLTTASMGAAAGHDHHGQPSYAELIVGTAGNAVYDYTWRQATAAGASSG